ncbi:MAG: DNA polymerase III subunit alpha [Candidatus Magasanikbacteria bacterium CG_4_10_14_0_8_um_filter_32_14]|uniref:DNA polymerase III subunit alpha n=1 Tax=Candidatus Magasanikbacteria bacterium CG_4_10_14_0_8_um_filter_32_14 TaxID=1974640 RepID=A0A2M7R923_9BACT|nr:MAG: DNA polymerase III subunit alpha [Candidatus Magasanikbacteria bacterium CG_4_10_14_0_8_um_filter_32_14]
MDFVHLHVHSHFSLLNGLTKIKPLVKDAKAKGFKALALTDYGSMYGAIAFYQVCLDEGIKPIIGFEAYVMSGSRSNLDEDKNIFRLILLAENFVGYQNLMRLSSRGHLEGFYRDKPCVDKELLQEYAQGIIALSGPIEAEIPQLLKNNKLVEAKKVALELQNIFGKENFYLEMQDHPAISGQLDVNTKLIKLSKDTKIPLVVTRDVHYLDFVEAEAQDILRCIANGWRVDQGDREDYRQVDRSLNSAQDIISRFRHIPEALENTVKIADRINLEIPLNNWHFAPVNIPEGTTYDEVLREQAFVAILKFYPEVTKELTDRLDYELDIIKTKGYSPYFLCVADYVGYAKQNGIVESTRGSAAGSLVSYVLGITTVDPMRFNLPFERFLNPFRPSPPDVDTDFADDRRGDMIKYVTEKYGADKVAQIITFGTMAARAAIRDVGRALGLSYNFCDQVAKLIPPGSQGFPMTIDRALNEEPDLKKLYDTNPDVKRLIDLARKVEGCNRHTSIHAAGVVISPTALTDFTPVQRETGGDRIITQYEMHAVETAGVLKNDFLGIRNLSILGNSMVIVEKTTGDKIDIYNLPLDDKQTFEMLARGETMGTFQLGGSGMTRWLKELKPTDINDIMAMVALYRPGPMESIPEYIKRKYHPEAVTFLDPRMEKYLGASFGLLVYQDDVMLTAIHLAGYDWMEADKFRKAMGKKIPEEMAKQKIKFYDGCLNIGKLKKETIDELWHAIEPFAAYGFNKAHAASYGIVAYQTSYMKAHYPVQYMTAVLQAESGDADKVSAIVGECRRIGIDVLPPDVNESFRSFAMVSKPGEKGRIRFGLSGVKNVGEHICEVIYRERKQNGSYQKLEDLIDRVGDKDLNKKSLESLAQAGALDCFNIDRAVLMASMENILLYVRQGRDKKNTSQNSLFAGTAIDVDSKITLQSAKPATMEQKLVWEKNLLGIYVSSHPFVYYENFLKNKTISIANVESFDRDAWIVVGGVIDSLKKKITKKGNAMMFATIQDMTGRIELLIFPKTYEETKDSWQEGNVVCIVGKTPREEGDNKIFVEKAYVLTKQNIVEVSAYLVPINKEKTESAQGGSALGGKISTKSDNYVIIYISKEDLEFNLEKIKSFLVENTGDCIVYFYVGTEKIKTNFRVNYSEDFESNLKLILPDINLEVK